MERLQKKHLEKNMEKESVSGIAVDEVSEFEGLIDEIIDREKLTEESRDNEGPLKKLEAEKEAAEQMRKEAMERFGQTRRRADADAEGDEGRQNKRRRSGNDAVDFLREKQKRRMSFEWKNFPWSKQEQEAARQAHVLKQQNSMFEAMQNMQVAMMQQQQQQTMMALVERLLPKQS